MKKVKFYKITEKLLARPSYGYQYDYEGITFFIENKGYSGHPFYHVTEKTTGLAVMDAEAHLTTLKQAYTYIATIIGVVKKIMQTTDYTKYKDIIAKAYENDTNE